MIFNKKKKLTEGEKKLTVDDETKSELRNTKQ
jgi:hypothetical protein